MLTMKAGVTDNTMKINFKLNAVTAFSRVGELDLDKSKE